MAEFWRLGFAELFMTYNVLESSPWRRTLILFHHINKSAGVRTLQGKGMWHGFKHTLEQRVLDILWHSSITCPWGRFISTVTMAGWVQFNKHTQQSWDHMNKIRHCSKILVTFHDWLLDFPPKHITSKVMKYSNKNMYVTNIIEKITNRNTHTTHNTKTDSSSSPTKRNSGKLNKGPAPAPLHKSFVFFPPGWRVDDTEDWLKLYIHGWMEL